MADDEQDARRSGEGSSPENDLLGGRSTAGSPEPDRPQTSDTPADGSIGSAPTFPTPNDGGIDDWTGLVLAGGHYKVVQRIGRGGMGDVYRAWDTHVRRDVVLKVPRRELVESGGFSARFDREIRSLANLAHPHVCTIFDAGKHEGVPFAVMQYLAGGSLKSRFAAGTAERSNPVDRLLPWLPHVADALDFIHAQGYVHRDVKPGNVLFDAHGNVYLSDFGIATAAAGADRSEHTLTKAGFAVGTRGYMALELFTGGPCDGRVDQYALAVTVYEVLCGRRPFEGPTPEAVVLAQGADAPPDPCEWLPEIPETLSAVVLKALSKDPNRRFPCCRAFADGILSTRSDRGLSTPIAGMRRRRLAALRSALGRLRESRDRQLGDAFGRLRQATRAQDREGE